MKNESIKIYLFDFKTKEYTCEKNALDDFGNIVTYANSTEIVPKIEDGFASCFDKETQTWTNIEDHRGKEGFVATESIKIKELGALPAGFSLEQAERVKTDDELREEIKSQRDMLLKESDFSQMIDAPLTAEQKKAWASYRKTLRELPQQELYLTNPKEVILPIKP